MQRIHGFLKCCMVFICACIATSSYAQEKSLESAKAERAAAGQAAEAAMLKGPQEIALRDQAKLKLPEG